MRDITPCPFCGVTRFAEYGQEDNDAHGLDIEGKYLKIGVHPVMEPLAQWTRSDAGGIVDVQVNVPHPVFFVECVGCGCRGPETDDDKAEAVRLWSERL